ncbi:MAG: TIGR03546 family protein [Nitrospinota bacterium]
MLRMLAKLLKVLNTEANPGQISLAFCFSMVAGLTPLTSFHNIFLLFLVLILRVNLSAFILGVVFFTGISFPLDPLFHRLGMGVLTWEPLLGLWTTLYNSSFGQLERFYNSIVMGSLSFSLLLFVPLYFVCNICIVRYREHVLSYVRKLRFVEIIKGSRLYRIYDSISDMKGSS